MGVCESVCVCVCVCLPCALVRRTLVCVLRKVSVMLSS